MCNKFLTLGFGCEQKVVLWFSRKDLFFSYWRLLVLLSMEWKQGRTLNGNAVVFYGVQIFVLFLLFGMCMLLLDVR